MPAVSDLQARDDHERVKETAFLAQKYSLVLILPAVFFLVVMGEALLTVWMGRVMADPAIIHTMATVLALLAIGHGMRLSQHSNFLVLVGCGRHQIFGRLAAWTALLVILLSVLAVKVLQAGLIGIAWAHLIPLVLMSGFVLPLYFSASMQISITQNVLRVWVPALRGAAPAMGILLVWYYLAPPANWIQLLGVLVTTGIVTLGGAWCFSLDRIERLRFKRLLFTRAAASMS
jgi:O-antigen/teichoic acid export membrane protein